MAAEPSIVQLALERPDDFDHYNLEDASRLKEDYFYLAAKHCDKNQHSVSWLQEIDINDLCHEVALEGFSQLWAQITVIKEREQAFDLIWPNGDRRIHATFEQAFQCFLARQTDRVLKEKRRIQREQENYIKLERVALTTGNSRCIAGENNPIFDLGDRGVEPRKSLPKKAYAAFNTLPESQRAALILTEHGVNDDIEWNTESIRWLAKTFKLSPALRTLMTASLSNLSMAQRRKSCLSQVAAGKLLGVNQSTIARWSAAAKAQIINTVSE